MSDVHKNPATIAAQSVLGIEPQTGAVAPPLYPSTTFARDDTYERRGPSMYARYGSPTLDHVEQSICALEHGVEAALFASGMAGITAVLHTQAQGSHVVAPSIMYHGTRDMLVELQQLGRLTVSFFNPADPDGIAKAMQPGKTKLVWIETPVNPSWDVIDIAAAAATAHAAGAILGVDSTVNGAVTTLPLTLGADLVFHSATKYLNGHSDVLAGVLVTPQDNARWQEIKTYRDHYGAILGPFEAWLLQRGMRTLYLRYRQASANALQLATYLADHPRLEKVLYPGLPDHPGHAIARRQMQDGFSGMMSILVKGDLAATTEVVKKLKIIVPATSLGGVESLAEHRKIIEGPDSPVPDNLIRLSIGIEAVEDLIADLDQALGQ